jgi:hypothetical protein
LKSFRLSAMPRSTGALGVNVILPRSTLAFQQIAHFDSHLLTQSLREYHLIFVLDGDDRHECMLNCSTL